MKSASIFYILLLCTLISCKEKDVHFLKHIEIPNEKWSYQDSLAFDFTIEDTVSSYQMFLELRTATNYKWSNVFLFSDLTFPNQKTRRDTFEFKLADNFGRWQGKKTGSMVENSIKMYNKKVNFPLKGKYRFTIYQAMRDLNLEGVMDVGVKIKTVQSGN
jgi:gliding motility-associated lipoprotein GldH